MSSKDQLDTLKEIKYQIELNCQSVCDTIDLNGDKICQKLDALHFPVPSDSEISINRLFPPPRYNGAADVEHFITSMRLYLDKCFPPGPTRYYIKESDTEQLHAFRNNLEWNVVKKLSVYFYPSDLWSQPLEEVCAALQKCYGEKVEKGISMKELEGCCQKPGEHHTDYLLRLREKAIAAYDEHVGRKKEDNVIAAVYKQFLCGSREKDLVTEAKNFEKESSFTPDLVEWFVKDVYPNQSTTRRGFNSY